MQANISDNAGSRQPVPLLLLTPEEAAAALRIGKTKLWTMTNDGRIPSIRVGNKLVRYRLDDLAEWVKSQPIDKRR